MAEQNIILGVTGGIAAYKTPELVRRLTERGATVQVVMTDSAKHFVTETTLQAVSGLVVRHNLWDAQAEAAMGHIELARWADLVLIAPATAEFMSRLAAGAAPDLLTTLCLASRAPIVLAPAMNHVMWSNAAVQANRELLEARGVRLLGPEDGDQACGETGVGRMMEPDDIAAAVQPSPPVSIAGGVSQVLRGKTVLVTAGPTREAIDPVRYISNRSSGRMGYALARAARDAGAEVVLISGPVSLAEPEGIECIHVETAQQMFAATHEHVRGVDIFIGAAAVSDYRPEKPAANKIKKTKAHMRIDMIESPDTLASVAKLASGPFTVGFAAETEQVRDYALGKLDNKGLDMIVANRVGADRGFDREDNAVEVFWHGGERSFPMTAKTKLASQLILLIAKRFEAKTKAAEFIAGNRA
ncbi:MAG: bifunctional phosphopantothenoylcysteine decarboxylase/phosphopantothenate--cysteine ligase CoaBC [Woeseia sp.]